MTGNWGWREQDPNPRETEQLSTSEPTCCDLCMLNRYNPHLLHSHWRHRRTFQQCSWKVNRESESCVCGGDDESLKLHDLQQMELKLVNRFKVKPQTDEGLTRCSAGPPPAESSGQEPCGQTQWLSARAAAPPRGARKDYKTPND